MERTAEASSPSTISMAKFSLATKRMECHWPSFRPEPVGSGGGKISLQKKTTKNTSLQEENKNFQLRKTIVTLNKSLEIPSMSVGFKGLDISLFLEVGFSSLTTDGNLTHLLLPHISRKTNNQSTLFCIVLNHNLRCLKVICTIRERNYWAAQIRQGESLGRRNCRAGRNPEQIQRTFTCL